VEKVHVPQIRIQMLGINNKEMPTEKQHKTTTMPAKWMYDGTSLNQTIIIGLYIQREIALTCEKLNFSCCISLYLD